MRARLTTGLPLSRRRSASVSERTILLTRRRPSYMPHGHFPQPMQARLYATWFSGTIPSAVQSVPAKAIIPTTKAARVAINNHLAFTPSLPFGKPPTTREPATIREVLPFLLSREKLLASTYNDAGSGFSQREHSSTLLRVGTSLICRIFADTRTLLGVAYPSENSAQANFIELRQGEGRRNRESGSSTSENLPTKKISDVCLHS